MPNSKDKFKSKSPRSNKATGLNVADILAFAAGKTPGEALTASDIDIAVKKAGISDKDARAIHKASDNFLSSGNKFLLQEDGNYNVLGPDGQITTAKRSTGNKVGFNAGDIVGLGNNMSKLVGLAKMYKGAFDESKKPVTTTSSESGSSPAQKKESVTQGVTRGGSADRKLTAREILEAQQRAQGMLDSLQDPAQIAKSQDLIMNQGAEANKTIPDWRDAATGKGTASNKTDRTTPGMPADNNMVIGNLIRAFDPKTWERLGIAFNPAQIWDEGARNEARTMGKEDAKELQKKIDDYERIQKEGTTLQKLLTPDPRVISNAMPNMGLLTPGPKQIGPTPFKGVGDKISKGAKNAFDALSKKIAPKVQMPPVQNVQKALPGKTQLSLPAPKANFQMVESGPVQSATRPVKEVLQLPAKATKPRIKMPKESPFRKGGKLPMGEDGIKLGRTPRFGGSDLPPLTVNGRNPLSTIDTGDLGAKHIKPVGLPASAKSTAQPTVDNPGAFKASELMTGSGGEEGGEGNGLAAFGKIAKYTLPFIGTALANRELGKVKPVNLKKANLRSGVVSDIPRPNMGLRYRVPTGNDLQSEVAGQKFADAQQRDAEANFNVANAQSRIAQGQQILNNENRNEMLNSPNHSRMFNAQQLMSLQGARAQNAQEPFIAAQHHLATDISTDAFLKASRDAAGAEAILKSADFGSDEWKAAAKKLGFKKGGKIKAKR
jgi:hypothetical protein